MTNAIFGHRTSRRGLLRAAGVGGMGLAVAALVGCDDDDDEGDDGEAETPEGTSAATATATATATASGEAKTGGQLRYAGVGAPGPLDLMGTASGGAFYYVGPAYSGLLTRSYDADFNMTLEPDIAESWEISSDGLTFTLPIRPGVKFHNRAPTDGRELTTEDIKFTIEREIEGDTRPRRSQYSTIESVEFPDSSTLKLTLKEPAADFLFWLADPYHIIVPTEMTDEFALTDAIGTGPFVLESYRDGVGAELVRNPDYFRPDRPYLDGITTTNMADQDAMIAAFRAGNLDLSAASTGGYLRPQQVDQVKSSVGDAQFYRVPNLNVGHLRYNLEEGPFTDDRVRRAFGLTIVDSDWMEALFDGEGSRTSPVPWGLGKWALPADQLPARGGEEQVQEAMDLMIAAGYDSDNALTVTNYSLGSPPSVSTTTGIALLEEALKQINVTMEIQNNDYATWLGGLVDKKFEFNLITGVLGFTEAGTYVETYFWDEGGRGYTKHGDAALNDLIAKQRVEVDEDTRVELVRDIQRNVVENEYYTMLQSDWINIAGQPELRGHQLDLLHGGNMRNAWQWWLDK